MAWDPDDLEEYLLSLDAPEDDCGLTHHFGPGIYIREVTFQPGQLILGHAHKHESLSIMLKGRLLLQTPDGDVREVVAPAMLLTPPGRKAAYAIEETVFQNVFATTETDPDKLEEMFVTKSAAWLAHHRETA
jgi:quercetin dioxygenase-like cupin family protein